MSKPPPELDGAEVIFWSWSGERPFFIMDDGAAGIAIHGLAICQYLESGAVYLFTCSDSWEVENDSPHESTEEAKNCLSCQYQVELVKWLPYQH